MSTIAMTDLQWSLIALLAVFNLVSAVRVTVYMRRMRRSALPWFFITLCFTAIPYSFYALYHNFAWLLRRSRRGSSKASAAPVRCRQCGAVLEVDAAQPSQSPPPCPRCGTPVEQDAHT